MKQTIYILVLLSILFFGCKEPNPAAPDTDRVATESINYEILDRSQKAIFKDSISEIIIENRSQLTTLLSNNQGTPNLDLLDKLIDFDFTNHLIVIVSVKTIGQIANIELDSIYPDANGKLQIAYRVLTTRGMGERVLFPTLVLKFEKRGANNFEFRRKYKTDGEIPKLDGFLTIATDVPINSRASWKRAFYNIDDFKKWATEFGVSNLSFLNNIDFEKEILMTVGSGQFNSGDYLYRITDIKQRTNKLLVESLLNVKNANVNFNKPNNHFVKIQKSALPIEFAPTFVEANYSNGKPIHFELFRLITQKATEVTMGSVTKASNIAELFVDLDISSELNPTKLEVDFEFYDLIIIKSPTIKSNEISISLDRLYLDGNGIAGNAEIATKEDNSTNLIETFMVLKIFKSSQKISKNFEVKIK